MNIEKIMVWIMFVLFLIDKYTGEEELNYLNWIIVFLFWIAWNTAGKKR